MDKNFGPRYEKIFNQLRDTLQEIVEKNEYLENENEMLREAVKKLLPRVHELRNNCIRNDNPHHEDIERDIAYAQEALEEKTYTKCPECAATRVELYSKGVDIIGCEECIRKQS